MGGGGEGRRRRRGSREEGGVGVRGRHRRVKVWEEFKLDAS